MNKAELINHLSEKVGITKKQAEDVVESFVNIVIQTLRAGGEVNIAGFGAFMARTRASRMGVNPQAPTQKMQIPAVVVPKFKAGKTLKDSLKAPKEVSVSAPTPTPVPAPVAPTPKPTPPATPSPSTPTPTPTQPTPISPTTKPPMP